MGLGPAPGGTVEQLQARHADALRALLLKDPVSHVYLLGLLEEFGVAPPESGGPRSGFAFHGRFDKARALTAALFVGGDGGLLVPSASEVAEISALGAALQGKLRPRAALGERAAVDALWRQLAAGKPRLSQPQRLFKVSADDLGPFTNPTLRLATEADLPELLPLAAGAVKAVRGLDPLAVDPAGFRARVLQRVRGRRTYVLPSQGRLVFKVDVGSRSQYGAELEGLFTVEDERRQGHAKLSLGQICRHLLSSLPRLTLRVDDQDEVLGGLARKVGFIGGASQRLLLAD